MRYIRINKNKKRLQFIKDDNIVFDFPCVFGKNKGRKLKRGDMKTPEGEYEIIVKNPQSKYCLSLGLNYPNIQDANDAFEAGIIGRADRDKIVAGHKKCFIPWSTPMGGEIYIHGNLGNRENWTKGCIMLHDRDVEKLYDAVEVEDKVIIE